jgi:hypothetical protein
MCPESYRQGRPPSSARRGGASGLLKNSLFDAARGAHRVQSPQPSVDPFAEDDTMRGNDPQRAAMFRYISPEERIP